MKNKRFGPGGGARHLQFGIPRGCSTFLVRAYGGELVSTGAIKASMFTRHGIVVNDRKISANKTKDALETDPFADAINGRVANETSFAHPAMAA